MPGTSRIVGCVTGVAILALATSGVAAAQAPEERFALKSPAVRAGEPLTLAFSLGTTGRFSTLVFGVSLPDDTVWNGRRFPRCSLKQLFRNIRTSPNPEKDCPRRSRVGSGTARMTHLGAGSSFAERARVVAVNAGSTVNLVWKGTMTRPDGRTLRRTLIFRGSRGDVTEWIDAIGDFLLPGLESRLDDLTLKIGRTLRGRGLIEAGRCRRGRWTATGFLNHGSDGGTVDEGTGTARDSLRCVR